MAWVNERNILSSARRREGVRFLFGRRRRTARGLGVKFQVPSVFASMTVAQNLSVAAARMWRDCVTRAHEVAGTLAALGLDELADMPAGSLAHGQRQWLEIGMAIIQRPRLLLLDEPTAGMSPEETSCTGALLLRLNKAGVTVLAIEHDMDFVRQVARNVTVLHLGKVFFEGSFEEVVRSQAVAEIYAGIA